MVTTMQVELIGGRWDGLIVETEMFGVAVFVALNDATAVATDRVVKGIPPEQNIGYAITEQKCDDTSCKGYGKRRALYRAPI